MKILWNHFYRTWYFGNIEAESQVNWIGAAGLERRADMEASFVYYDGIPQDELPGGNPENFLYRNLALVVGPADLNGTARAHLAIPRPGQARLDVGLRAGAAARARRSRRRTAPTASSART